MAGLLQLGVGLAVVDVQDRVGGPLPSHHAEVLNRPASQFHIRIVVGDLDEAGRVPAHEQRLNHLFLDVGVGLFLIELPHLVACAHHPELSDGLRAQLRRLLARRGGEHALAIAAIM